MKKSIEERLQAVEDMLEIMNLKSEYWRWCDGGWNKVSHNGEHVAALFTEDGIWEILDGQSPGAKGVGRQGIRELFDRTYAASVPFAFHHGGSPLIRVTGDSATGSWNLTALLTIAGQGAVLGAIYYSDEFVRTSEGWRIKRMTLTPVLVTPFSEGWGALAHLTRFSTAAVAPKSAR
jgi:SnoaL-like domain